MRKIRSRYRLRPMTTTKNTHARRVVVAIVALAMLVIAPVADARPSLDKRIRAIAHRVQVLERQNADLQADNAALTAGLEAERTAGEADRSRFSSLLNCLMLAPAGRSLAGQDSVVQPFGPDLAVFFHPSCSSPIMPPQSDEFSVHPVQLRFAY